VSPGSVVVKEWEFFNPPDAPKWEPRTKLVFMNGAKELVENLPEVDVPLAAPGEKVVVSAVLQVPTKPGNYKATFALVDSKRWPYPEWCWVDLVVPGPSSESSSSVASSSVASSSSSYTLPA